MTEEATLEYGYNEHGQAVEPGDGYRLLRSDEVVDVGDQATDEGGDWFNINVSSDRNAADYTQNFNGYRAVRRRVEAEVQPAISRRSPLSYGTQTSGERIDAGYGYRLLDESEVVQAGDEWCFAGESWSEVEDDQINAQASSATAEMTMARAIRRKIDVGEGYRLVELGESVESGDEFCLLHDNTWQRQPGSGYEITPHHSVHRRRVAAPEQAAPERRNPYSEGPADLDCGEGYRFVQDGEEFLLSDEYHDEPGPVWRRREGGGVCNVRFCRPHRRRIETPTSTCPDPDYPELQCGEGWRFLQPGEHILETDEHYTFGGDWVETNISGEDYDPRETNPLRRRLQPVALLTFRHPQYSDIEPGDGWRILQEGELQTEGDEYWQGWADTPSWQSLSPITPGRRVTIHDHFPQRRRYTPSAQVTPSPTPTTPSRYRLLAPTEPTQAGDVYGIGNHVSGSNIGRSAKYFHDNGYPDVRRQWSEGQRILASNILPKSIFDLVQATPALPNLRGMIRAAAAIVVPPEVFGESQRIVEWIESNCQPQIRWWEGDGAPVVAAPAPAPVATAPQPAAARVNGPTCPPGYYRIQFERGETESGRVRYSIRRQYTGTIDVPAAVAAEGEDAIREYVNTNWDSGRMDSDDDGYEYEDYDGRNTDHDMSIDSDDIDSAVEAAAPDEEEPDHADNEPAF